MKFAHCSNAWVVDSMKHHIARDEESTCSIQCVSYGNSPPCFAEFFSFCFCFRCVNASVTLFSQSNSSLGSFHGESFDNVGNEEEARCARVEDETGSNIAASYIRFEGDEKAIFAGVFDHQAQVHDDYGKNHQIAEAQEAGGIFRLVAQA